MSGLSDKEIGNELVAQSHLLFGEAGWGGVFGPTKAQFDKERPEGWPYSGAILRMFGLVRGAEGWSYLLQAFGLMPPGPKEIQQAAQRRKDTGSPGTSIPLEDESYPGLMASSVEESVQLTPLGDGWYQRTTTSVYQLR